MNEGHIGMNIKNEPKAGNEWGTDWKEWAVDKNEWGSHNNEKANNKNER